MKVVINRSGTVINPSVEAILHLIDLNASCIVKSAAVDVPWLSEEDYNDCVSVTPLLRKLNGYYHIYFDEEFVYFFEIVDSDRTNEALIDVLELLGERFFHDHKRTLKVVEIPEGVKFKVVESATGVEHLEEIVTPRVWK